MKKKGLIAILFISLLPLSAYLFKFQILYATGNYLIAEDPLEKSDAIFVLSGGPFERGMAAMDIYFQGYSDTIICMGSVVPQDLRALGFNYKESELIKHFLIHSMQIPEQHVKILPEGSSTFEESAAILDYCQKQGFKTVIIVSSAFHTRRIQQTFKEKFKDRGIKTIVRGHIRRHDPPYWWQNEQDMINVNNEYIKLLYYWWRY
ncbi:MAG: YdcF family protein [Chitinophagales bacterium]